MYKYLISINLPMEYNKINSITFIIHSLIISVQTV